MQNYKTHQNNKGNLYHPGHGDDFLDIIPRHNPWKKELISWNLLKLKTSAIPETMLREWEEKQQTGEKKS